MIIFIFNFFLSLNLLLFFNIFIFLILPFSYQLSASTTFCEQFPGDSICQQFMFKNINNKRGQQNCNYQDLWLIPGRADASCTRPNSKRLVEMDAKQVKIRPSIIKFPGCFTVEIRNINIMDNNGLPNSIFAKTEYQWLNVRGSEKAKCQNSSLNGCGGFGNNCYYCDICESLKKVDEEKEKEREELPSDIAQQLKGIKCPSEPGLYTFRKQFCFNDWHWLDNDGDCRLDILSETEDDQSGIKIAMSALQQVGYGTVVTKIRLAFNATSEIERKKAIKEAQIERNSLRDFEQRIKNLDSIPSNEVRNWYIEQQKNIWHKNDYLPWLLYENEFACIRLTFDVCERQPQQRWEGGYTCV